MVHPAGFEPATPWFEAKYSNPLSYGCAITPSILTDRAQLKNCELAFSFNVLVKNSHSR